MFLIKKIIKYYKTKQYLKYRKSFCPKCNKFNWKYSYAPYIHKREKRVLEARICGKCGYKDKNGHIISDEIKFSNNTNFKIKN